MKKIDKKVLVILSGGQDSTTCLLQALTQYTEVHTVSFDYGQQHKIELEQAKKICEKFNVPNEVLSTDIFTQINDSALLGSNQDDVAENHRSTDKLPASFVPGRNIFFLTMAAAYAYKLGIYHLITGVSEEDYSGYPDCREQTIQAMALTLSNALDIPFTIETPLIHMSKADEVALMMGLPGGPEALAMTHTCYRGERPPCGECPSCKLRAEAFKKAGFADPLIEATRS
jgi:7-cyano-7-deazaguanine synthase